MKASKSIKTLAAAMAVVMVMAAAAFALSPVTPDYIITGNLGVGISPQPFKVIKGNTVITTGEIQAVIDYIRADANPIDAAIPTRTIIQFGENGYELNIGPRSAVFGNAAIEGGTWGNITLNGKITSTNGNTVVIGSGVSLISVADITTADNDNVSAAIEVLNGGTLNITGGTLTSTTNLHDTIAVRSVEGGGGLVILSGSPTITGKVRVGAGKLSVTGFNPGEKQYTLSLRGVGHALAAGDAAVIGGAQHINNFTLVDSDGFTLKASGDDLVLHDPTTSVISRSAAKGGQFGILQNGASLQIVGTTQAATLRVYDVRGKVMMNRTAMPNERISVSRLARGTYVVKAAGKSVKLVRR